MVEEKKYWTELPSEGRQFFKILIADFLRIPTKFVKNFKEKLFGTIQLIGPSGSFWPIKLERRDDGIYFGDGWHQFVKDHSLAVEDLLVFRYEGDSTFKVSMFDVTACEREGAYFVKNNVGSCSKCARDTKQKKTETVVLAETSESESTENQRHAHRKAKHKNDKDENRLKAEGSKQQETAQRKYSFYFVSKRKEVTLQEKQRAFRMASEYSSTSPTLTVVMKPTHVYKYFYVSIGKRWMNKHIPRTPHNAEIQLRVPPGTKCWSVRVKNSQWKGGLGKGWSEFVMDNNLEEDDVCVFELKQGSKGRNTTVIFDVMIFRVVDELVPLKRTISRPLPH